MTGLSISWPRYAEKNRHSTSAGLKYCQPKSLKNKVKMMPLVSTDKHDYELLQDWGRLPEEWTFGVVSSVATDSQDRVYVYQRKDPPIVVFDSEGN